MSALDRALIRAYRQQRGGAASCQPQPYAPVVQPYAPHAAELELAGPHYRIDASHAGDAAHDVGELALAATSVLSGEWSTFRVDVGVTGVPVAPMHWQPAEPDADHEPVLLSATGSIAEEPATMPFGPSEPVPDAERPTPRRVRRKPVLEATSPRSLPIATSGQSVVRPQLVVDHFLWPDVCDELARTLIGDLAKLKQSMSLSQCRAVALVGTDAGAGVSTVLLTVARRLAAEGTKATLVDANFSRPALAEMLSVVASRGWEAALDGTTSLDEILIASNEDQIVLAPLAGSRSEQFMAKGASAIAAVVRPLLDLNEVLLIDGGSLDSPASRGALQPLVEAASLDGVYLVCDRRMTTPQEVVGHVRELKSSGISVLGTIENFCPKGDRL